MGNALGRPRIGGEERISTNIRLTCSLRDRLDAEASRRCVSRNLIIERACEDWLDKITTDPIAP